MISLLTSFTDSPVWYWNLELFSCSTCLYSSTVSCIFVFQRRGMMIGLQVCMPYLLHLVLDKMERKLQSAEPFPIPLTGPQRDRLLQIIPVLRHAATLIHRMHLSLFYIQGIFYHLAKRISGIHYVSWALQDIMNLFHVCKGPIWIKIEWLSLHEFGRGEGLEISL